MPSITFGEAIRQATHDLMAADERVVLIGEGVPDPKAVFNTTKGLQEAYPDRVFDMPVSENGLTGVCIGLAIQGLRPILVHQRIDFSLYAMDQIVNNAAKWHSMYGGRSGSVPMVVRCILGRGWGQGNQHSQSLSHIYATIPGLKVVCPSNARDAYNLFISSVHDQNPVMFIEHRWLHNTTSEDTIPDAPNELGKGKISGYGKDITIVAWSYMVAEALKAREALKKINVSAEVVDLRTIRPLDTQIIKHSVNATGRLLVLEEAWKFNSLSGEIITQMIEEGVSFKTPPRRITLPDYYSPSSHFISKYFYPQTSQIVDTVCQMVEAKEYFELVKDLQDREQMRRLDVPDDSFKGPF